MLWVVKIGGSLAKTSVLESWLNSLAKLKQTKVVIVPGGGPFADQVRESQTHWKFDDSIAHQMALLAMEQYGLMMSGICSQIKPARNLSDIQSLLQTGNICVWLPYEMVSKDKTIPESWETTSDSLAAWLANLLEPTKLILVKSVKCEEKIITTLAAAERGWVDPFFPYVLKQATYEIQFLYKDDYSYLERMIQGESVGTFIANKVF